MTAKKHPIPAQSLLNHIAIIGKTGSGKTNTAKGAAEQVMDGGARICAVDPTGVWWGLRSSADGKKKGYPVVVFGGNHADIAISDRQGAAIAGLVADAAFSTIIDVSRMGVGERTRFFTDFAETLLQRNANPLHVFLDEAHLFAPQGKVNDPQSGRMLGATNNMVSLGRSHGLRICMISQRPAKLHKDSLTQVETLISMRLIAPQDRQAVKDWVGEWYETSREVSDIMAGLARLPTGTGYIWAPETGFLEKVSFPKARTLDTGAGLPNVAKSGKMVMASIDMDAIKAALGESASAVLADDPKALKGELSKMEYMLRVEKRMTEALQKQIEDERAHPLIKTVPDVDAINLAYEKGFKHGVNEMAVMASNALKDAVNPASLPQPRPEKEDLIPTPKKPVSGAPAVIGRDVRTPAPRLGPGALNVAPVKHIKPQPGGALGKGERKILTAIVQAEGGATRAYCTVMCGYTERTRNAYLQSLAVKGFIVQAGDRFSVTAAGAGALGDIEPLPTGAALRGHWLGTLPKGESTILNLLFDAHPDGRSRHSLSELTGYTERTRNAYLQSLRTRMLIEPTSGGVRAVERLFA